MKHFLQINFELVGVSIENSKAYLPPSASRKSELAGITSALKPLADEVIKTLAELTDFQKVQAEIFNDKTKSLLPAIAYLVDVKKDESSLNYDQFIQAAFTGALASFTYKIME